MKLGPDRSAEAACRPADSPFQVTTVEISGRFFEELFVGGPLKHPDSAVYLVSCFGSRAPAESRSAPPFVNKYLEKQDVFS